MPDPRTSSKEEWATFQAASTLEAFQSGQNSAHDYEMVAILLRKFAADGFAQLPEVIALTSFVSDNR